MSSLLITGATGTLGSALVRQFLTEDTFRRIICFSRDELKQHELRQQLPADPRLRWWLGDVRDKDRLRLACRNVQVVIHTAALKQVPALQDNPLEAVKTNVQGTANLLEAALECGVEKVLAISTDKAVAPVNLYGATKAVMERIVLDFNGHCGPACSVVRYGNVAGSRGSVVPLWRLQAASGKPLTLTDSTMTRFWITLEQAVRFVTRSLDTMHGGELFVPAMPSVLMADVAQCVASLTHAPITITGTRPGEKLHECVVAPHESVAGLPTPYCSNTNGVWLKGQELADAVEAA